NKHKDNNFGGNWIHYYWVQGGVLSAGVVTTVMSIGIPGPTSQRIPSAVSNVRTSDQLQDSDVLRRLSVCQVGGIMFFAEETIPPFCVVRLEEGRLQPCCYAQQYADAALDGYGPF